MSERTFSLQCPPELEPFGQGNKNYRKNQSAARHNGHYVCETHCCCVCGKVAVNATEFVYLANIGRYITEGEFEQNERDVAARGGCPDDLGMYPVGSDCAKKLRSAGIPTYPAPKVPS